MASQKEYQMLFTLAGSLNANFSQSFQKAQAEMARLKEESKNLASLMSDVHSYQRHQKELENTQSKYSMLTDRLARVQQELKAVGGFDLELEDRERRLQHQVEITQRAIDEKNAKLADEQRRLEAAGYNVNDLAKAEADLTQKMKDNAHAFDEAKSSMDGATNSVKSMADLISAVALTDKVKEVADAYLVCVEAAGDLQYAMSNVEALTGANAYEMDQLTQKAKDLGAETVYTAGEVSAAMGYMGMAGWNAQEMLSGIPGVIALAAASGEDLATVSDIVTDNLTAFRLTAADTARMADVLAAAATNSNTNVAIMGETFKNSASIAGALGYSIEDVATAIGIMANSGIKGSMAGTGLRNIFNGLLKDTTLTSEAFGEYTISATKADGTLKSFTETVDELRAVFNQMSEAEKVNNARTLAGARSYNGLLAIVNATDEQYQQLYEDIANSTGAAQKMADIKLDNFNGQLKILQSAWDAVKVTIGETYQNELTNLLDVGADLLHMVNEFIQAHPALAKGIIAGAAALGAFTLSFGMYTAAVKLATLVQETFNIELAVTAGIIGGVAVGIGVLVGLVAALSNAKDETVGLSAASKAQKKEAEDLSRRYSEMSEAVGEEAAATRLLKVQLDEAEKAYHNGSVTLKEYVAEQEAVIQSSKEARDEYRKSIDGIDQYEASNKSLASYLDLLVDENGQVVGSSEKVKAVVDALNESIPNLGLAYDSETNSINSTTEAIIAYSEAEATRQRIEAKGNALKEAIVRRNQLEEARNKAKAEYDAAKAAWQDVIAKYGNEEEAVFTYGMAGQGDVVAKVQAANNEYRQAETILNDLESEYAATEAEIEALANETANLVNEQATLQNTMEEHDIRNIVGTHITALQELAVAYSEAYESALQSVSGQYKLWDEVDKVEAVGIGTLNKRMEEQTKYWTAYNDNLKLLEEAADDPAFVGLAAVIGSFADGSAESVNAVAGIANAIKKGDADAVGKLIENYSQLIAIRDESADSIAQLKTDFDDVSEMLITGMQSTIESLSLTAEAKRSALNTIDSYINEFKNEDNLRRVNQAVDRFKLAAFSGSLYADTYVPDRGYAGGTAGASAGWRMVGEEGPELMFFGGGERVANNSDTKRVAAAISGGNTSNVSVAFNISGNADAGALATLREYGEEFAERVLDVINGANSNAFRRAYV